ncbi:MAG TPA: hypothetical protein VFW11_10040 [Cyclobacteriaceae bacterium]|nr:hypothetical protein [Cyclobacteriaceae bacterium]
MFTPLDFTNLIKDAWDQYDPSRKVRYVIDISAMVSTNHVFRVKFEDDDFVIAKCSYFGKFEHFKEDHTIISVLGNSLPPPFENFLARSLIKNGEVYTYKYKQGIMDAWVVFYNPIQIDQRLPRQLEENHIRKLGNQLAKFHKACTAVSPGLPPSSKTLEIDVQHLLSTLETEQGKFEHRLHIDAIKKQCDIFLKNLERLGYTTFPSIPVFVDWNLGNFSVTKDIEFFSRWDYDWFRMSSRMMDFYFFSRVSSSIGDRTVFSYLVDPLMETRFLLFLEEYHKEFPLTENEVRFLTEAYRFFILNYVVKYGRYFFHQVYATRLLREAFQIYFPSIDSNINVENILRTLKL